MRGQGGQSWLIDRLAMAAPIQGYIGEMSGSYSLVKGGNISVRDVFGEPAAHIAVTIAAQSFQDSPAIPADVSVLILGVDGAVRSNDDLIFYNQPSGVDGAIRLRESATVADSVITSATVELDLAALPDSVDRVVIAASVGQESGPECTFGDAALVRMSAAAHAEPDVPVVVSELTGLSAERALIFGEVYRRGMEWKIRAVGQGYALGLRALVTEFGIDVDDEPQAEAMEAEPTAAAPTLQEGTQSGPSREPTVALARKRKQVAKIPTDWRERVSPGLAVDPLAGPWRHARLFPTVGIRSSAEQEGRTTSVLLSVMSIVPELGRRITGMVGAPRGRIETYTEVMFSVAGQDFRPDGLIRVTRGSKVWTALVEVKTAKGSLTCDQIEGYVKVARAKGFDAVVTISCALTACPAELPLRLESRPPKNVKVLHLSWEEIITEAALLQAVDVGGRTHARMIEEFLVYAADQQSGMWGFGDMGRHWVKVRDGVADGTLAASDSATAEICSRFDQLTRHIALQLTALTGQVVAAQSPGSPIDSVSRAKQLADSGEVFGTLRVIGATAPIVINANLARQRIGCTQSVLAPRAGRPGTKVTWLLRQLDGAPPRLRLTAHHFGSRTDVTSALLESAREDPVVLIPPGGKDIREFSVTSESSMGSKRSSTENGFVASMVSLVNGFHRDVTENLRAPRIDR